MFFEKLLIVFCGEGGQLKGVGVVLAVMVELGQDGSIFSIFAV